MSLLVSALLFAACPAAVGEWYLRMPLKANVIAEQGAPANIRIRTGGSNSTDGAFQISPGHSVRVTPREDGKYLLESTAEPVRVAIVTVQDCGDWDRLFATTAQSARETQDRVKRESEKHAARTSASARSEFCAAQWPDDYRMREYCLKRQREAEAELPRLAPESRAQRVAYSKCIEEWGTPDQETADATMLVYCLRKQYEAIQRLGE